MKKALLLGISGSFFFAFTFILNRSMNLGGGYWLWSACLRYIFTLPMTALLISRNHGIRQVLKEIQKKPAEWILWSTVGFGLFYAPLTLASVYGESWLTAASWQMTIVAGVLLTPLFHKPIPVKNLAMSMLILAGIFLMQAPHLFHMDSAQSLVALIPILVAAFSYPLGNRKMMEICSPEISTFQRVFGMTLCSMPFWLVLSVYAYMQAGIPSAGQTLQSVCVALFSGVIATVLFFRATDLVRHDQKKLALIEATQCGEVLFTLLGGICLLGDAVPEPVGFAGIGLIVIGMILNSLMAGQP